MSAVKLISLEEAASELGIERDRDLARWMRRQIRKREAEMGLRILVRSGRGRGGGLKVSLPALKMAWPDRYDPSTKITKRIEQKLRKIHAHSEANAEQMDEIKGDIAALAQCFRELLRKVATR